MRTCNEVSSDGGTTTGTRTCSRWSKTCFALRNFLKDASQAPYYITIFIVHHLKNEAFFKEVCKKTSELYKEYSEAQLTRKEIQYLEDRYHSTEKLILERMDNIRRESEERSKGERCLRRRKSN